MRISRSRGVDGLEAALAGVDAVVDATSYETAGRGDAAGILAEIATGTPQGRYRDVAGPEPQDLVDMARTNDARGHAVKLVPAWSPAPGPEMAGDVLLPRRGRPHSASPLRRVARKAAM